MMMVNNNNNKNKKTILSHTLTFRIKSATNTVNIINNTNKKYNHKSIHKYDDYMSIGLPDNVNNKHYSFFFRVIECTVYLTVIKYDDFILNVKTNLRIKIRIKS
jgi:hypothetical protein